MLNGLPALLKEEDVLKVTGCLYETVHHGLAAEASVSSFRLNTAGLFLFLYMIVGQQL